jgi:dihydroorotase-like cyclic amidohydrolase
MPEKTIKLPEIIIDTHCHGRGLKQAHKTTVQQTMSEAIKMLVVISIFMPNTDEPLITIEALDKYISLIRWAKKVLGIDYPQYVYFGITDYNLAECEIALRYPEVIGLKDYPLSADGKTVTTGTIGVSKQETRLAGLRLVTKYNKVYARHCDNPEVIAREGHTIKAEVIDVVDMISLASEVPGAKVVICHVSCRESAETILKAQQRGMQIIIELCPHYLWFDADGANWNPNLDPVFYKCFNNLRSSEDREFLISLLLSDNLLIIIGSDNAPHTTWEKIEKKFGGLPSNQEMVAVICTLAKQYSISDQRVAELLSWNAGEIFGIKTSKKLKLYHLIERIDALTYNNGDVTNPWNGSRLLFPYSNIN